MKIMVPLNDVHFIDDYIRAGADEFYIGFTDDAWRERFGENADLNRMSAFKKMANGCSFRDVLRAADVIRSRGGSLFVTFNSNAYTEEQLAFLMDYMRELKTNGVSGVIISSPGAAMAALRVGMPPVASTMCAVYNSDIAKFYYGLGVRRMILPRDMTLAEMADVVRNVPDAEYEAFFMRNGCRFSDAYCLGIHSERHGAICGQLRRAEWKKYSCGRNFSEIHETDLNKYLYDKAFHNTACGLCSLYALREMGVHSLKIVGRADNPAAVIKDIALTKRNIAVMETVSSEEDYLRKMAFPEARESVCLLGFGCYYPESRFGDAEGGGAMPHKLQQ